MDTPEAKAQADTNPAGEADPMAPAEGSPFKPLLWIVIPLAAVILMEIFAMT